MKEISEDDIAKASHPTQMKWNLYLPKAFHPLLLQQHRQNMQKATKDVNDAKAVSFHSDGHKLHSFYCHIIYNLAK